MFDRAFNANNPFWKSMGTVFDAFTVNTLWLLCCLPVVTIGPATAAAYYCLIERLLGQSVYISRDFFRSFRQNLKQGIVLGVPVVVYCITKVAWRAIFSYVTGAAFLEGVSMWLSVALLLALMIMDNIDYYAYDAMNVVGLFDVFHRAAAMLGYDIRLILMASLISVAADRLIEKNAEIERNYRDMIAEARRQGKDVAADNLEHFLSGNGMMRTLNWSWLRSDSTVLRFCKYFTMKKSKSRLLPSEIQHKRTPPKRSAYTYSLPQMII